MFFDGAACVYCVGVSNFNALFFPLSFLCPLIILSVSYDVKVMSEEAMNTMSVKMAATFSDSTAFTTVLKSAMKTNGVTSVAVDDITSDTSSVPANAGTTGATVPSSTGPVIDSATSATVASFVVMVAVVVAMFM